MEDKNIWYRIGQMEASIYLIEQQLESLKEIQKSLIELASNYKQ